MNFNNSVELKYLSFQIEGDTRPKTINEKRSTSGQIILRFQNNEDKNKIPKLSRKKTETIAAISSRGHRKGIGIRIQLHFLPQQQCCVVDTMKQCFQNFEENQISSPNSISIQTIN